MQTDCDAKDCNDNLAVKVKEELFLIYDEEAIELALSKMQEVFRLVVKERRASLNANSK